MADLLSPATSTTLDQLFQSITEFRTGFRNVVPVGECHWHNHYTFEIVYHPSGRGTTGIDGGEDISFQEKAIVVYPPFLSHNQICTLAGEDWCIHGEIHGALPAELSNCLYLPRIEDRAVHEELAVLSDVPPSLSPLHRLAYSHRFAALMLLLVEKSVLIGCHAERNTADIYVDAACAYISKNFRTLRHMEEVADHVGISYHYLRHTFKEKMGMRLVDYVMTMRVDRAKELLIHSALPLKSIARLSGFENERYFSTCFRKMTGCTPGHLRGSSS